MRHAALRWTLAGILAIATIGAGSCSSRDTASDMSSTGSPHPDLAMATCFSGTPKTQSDLLNQCTNAQQVDRPSLVPTSLWNGTTPLTQLP